MDIEKKPRKKPVFKVKPVPPPAPIGNQYALGNSGRPSKIDLPAMSRALDEWSKRDDALHFAEFSLEYDEYPQRLYEWRDKSPEFADSMKRARARIAVRIRKKLHDKVSPHNYGLFMRELPYYDELLHSFEREEKVFEWEMKSRIEAEAAARSRATPEQEKNHEAIMSQLKSLQDQSSQCKTEESKTSNE